LNYRKDVAKIAVKGEQFYVGNPKKHEVRTEALVELYESVKKRMNFSFVISAWDV